jgi:hypothetical protein
MKAGITEDYKAACDSSGNWVACAIYAAYIEDSDQKTSAKYYEKVCNLGKKGANDGTNKILQKSCDKSSR